MRTGALVGTDGPNDRLCVSHFGNPGMFAAVLGEAKGGYFQDRAALSELQAFLPVEDQHVTMCRGTG